MDKLNKFDSEYKTAKKVSKKDDFFLAENIDSDQEAGNED